MISWIQRYFHKHFKFVFLLVLAAMAIPLIVIFSPSSGAGRAGNKVLERPFFGVNLGNEEQARRVFADGNLSATLRAGYNALQGGQLQQYSLQRVAALAMADELHLPAPTADQVVVIGAGPAGMKAAATAARQGHEVILIERRNRTGGQLRIAAKIKGRSEIGCVIDHLDVMVAKYGGEVSHFVPPNVAAALKKAYGF